MVRKLIKKYKAGIVFLGDIVAFFASLAIALYIRYGHLEYVGAFRNHIAPFSILLIVFVSVFYMADLYTYTSWRTTADNAKRFLVAMSINVSLSIAMFYIFGDTFKLTPKLNLFIFAVLFSMLDAGWRYALAKLLADKNHTTTVLMLATSRMADVLLDHVHKHPQLGYVVHKLNESAALAPAIETRYSRPLVVIDETFLKDPEVARVIRELIAHNGGVETLSNFSEQILGRIPLSEIDETWLIEETKRDRSWYESEKRMLDVTLAIFGIIVFSPFFIVLAFLIPLTSKGPAIYRQERIGRGGKTFTIYKFRNMYNDEKRNPDKAGAAPVWWQKNDPRVTPLGRILRKTHLDELPQLWNILRGDMSVVGPRPERPHFTKELEAEMPQYALRSAVRPGLTGWAQLRFQYAGTVKEWSEKLEYDLYYIKHRNILFDLGVIARTIQKML